MSNGSSVLIASSRCLACEHRRISSCGLFSQREKMAHEKRTTTKKNCEVAGRGKAFIPCTKRLSPFSFRRFFVLCRFFALCLTNKRLEEATSLSFLIAIPLASKKLPFEFPHSPFNSFLFTKGF